MDVAAHYRGLLASHYSWMLGGDIEQVATQDRQLFEKLELGASSSGLAVDLGCGPGPQTLALADMGFGTVVGVDTSRELLDVALGGPVAHAEKSTVSSVSPGQRWV